MLTTMILPCACYAASATVFYKKNIRKDGLPTVLLLAMLGYGVEHSTAVIVVTVITAIMLFVLGHIDTRWLVSTAKLDVFLAFLVAVVDVKFNVIENMNFAKDVNIVVETPGASTLGVNNNFSAMSPLPVRANGTVTTPVSLMSSTVAVFKKEYVVCIGIIRHLLCEAVRIIRPINWNKVRIILISVPQFIRKPIWLKTKLQDVRAKLGPIYVMYVVNYAFKYCRDVPSEGRLELRTCWCIVALAAVFAGVFTRPDNSTTCDLVRFPSSYSCRKRCHKYLMISTFLFCSLVFGYEFCFVKGL